MTVAGPDKLFSFDIGYNTGGVPLYNGNISQTQWRTANADSSLKSYEYTYDALSRITGAIDNTGNYNLDLVEYDKMGNITKLKRKGHTNAGATTFGDMDDLTYSYTGNQLQGVSDLGSATGFLDGNTTGTDYEYDSNGNLEIDRNKGITEINYNHLNLPEQITVSGTNAGTITYVYAADGTKLKKTVSTGAETLYANGYVYEGNILQFFPHSEGYVTPDGNGWRYVYQYKDHLNNIRLSYTEDPNGGLEIVEDNAYYPFGIKMRGFNGNVSALGNDVAQRWKFGGKEFDESLDGAMGTYDFGARTYDPWGIRWWNVDPLAEQMRRHSPYNYAFNNPLRFIDPGGMAPKDIIVNGDEEFRKKTLENLQALTAETLAIDDSGKVIITDCGGTDNCGAGTDLVSDLVHSDKIVTITKTNEGNQTLAENGYALQNKDGTPNRGTNATIEFNPEKTEGGIDVNGNTERPIEIGLGHELAHARTITEGTVDPNLTNPPVLDPTNLAKGIIIQLNNDELNTFKVENQLRSERNLPARQINGKKKKGVTYKYY